MTYEHGPGGYPASPDVDVDVPELCEKCSRDCPDPCEAFKRLESVRELKNEYKKAINPSPQPYMILMRKIVHDLEKILEAEDSMTSEKRSGKANRWGILMVVSMIFTTSFFMYPLMRKCILIGIGLFIFSGLMTWRQIKREGWP